ncbi:MAG: hypothetical protein C0412_20325 [Flavobacterium sp.]|nr:hypothetical protein [Flavobacterium sp.]
MNKLNSILSNVAIGQELDIFYSTEQKIRLKDILKVLEYKTAKYTIEGPLHLGAILAEADQRTIRILSRYAIPLGIAFQIQDDILGIFGDEKKTGKSIDSDLKQGKQTLLIFQAQKYATPKQKKIIKHALGNQNLNRFQVEEIRRIIRETKSLEYAQKLTKKLVNQSKDAVKKSSLPQEVKYFLMDFADYVISRNK